MGALQGALAAPAANLLVVYVAIAVVGVLLAAVLSWFGALLAALISVIGLFWVQGALVTAVEDVRDGRSDLSLGETFKRVGRSLDRSWWRVCSPGWVSFSVSFF